MGETNFRTMASAPKLTFLQLEARAEPIRLLTAVHDIIIEDERLSFPEWGERKPNSPYGHVPFLEIPGQAAIIPTSNAILRYFGKISNTYPTDLFLAAHIDAVLEALEDLLASIRASVQEQDPEKKLALRKVWLSENAAPWFAKIQKQHEALGNKKYFATDELTIADYKLAATV